MKAIPQYAAIVRHYPTIKGPITELVQKEFNFFSEVRINADVMRYFSQLMLSNPRRVIWVWLKLSCSMRLVGQSWVL